MRSKRLRRDERGACYPRFSRLGNHPLATRSRCSKSSPIDQNDEAPHTASSVDHNRLPTASDRQSHDKKNPPASNAEIVFPLDDQRVKKSDNQKRRHADDDTRQVIMSQKFHILGFWDKDTENRMTRNGPAAFPLCGVAFDMACYCAARKKDAILMPRLCPIFVAE